MTKSTITDERITSVIERLEHFASNLKWTDVRGAQDLLTAADGLRELQERRKYAMDSEPVEWLNGCNKSVPAALRYLAENPRPIGGESSFNTAHLYQLAREIELMAEGTLYRHAQPAPVAPDAATAIRACLSEFPESARDIVEECADIAENACRAAMLQAEHVTTDNKLGNSPVIPDGYAMVPKEATEKMLIAGLEEANPLGGLIDWDASRGDCNTREQVQEIFKAMLAAAPQEVK